MFKKIVRARPAYQQIADQIEELIVGGSLAPGDRLSGERELAEKFDVSRRALREALRIVEQKGLIEIRKGGSFVREASLDPLSEGLGLLIRFNRIPWKDLVEFRLEVDTLLTRKAARKATARDVVLLENLITEGMAVLDRDPLDWKALMEVDLKVHLALARIAGNPIFEWMLRVVIDNILMFYEQTAINPVDFALDSYRDMIALVQAIRQGDVDGAVAVIRDHVTILSRKYFPEDRELCVLLESGGHGPGTTHGEWTDHAMTRRIEPAR